MAGAKVGRKLRKEEVVHHWDENHYNLDPNNLQVTNHADHNRWHHKGKKYAFSEKRAQRTLAVLDDALAAMGRPISSRHKRDR